jgi:hypothetical protein
MISNPQSLVAAYESAQSPQLQLQAACTLPTLPCPPLLQLEGSIHVSGGPKVHRGQHARAWQAAHGHWQQGGTIHSVQQHLHGQQAAAAPCMHSSCFGQWQRHHHAQLSTHCVTSAAQHTLCGETYEQSTTSNEPYNVCKQQICTQDNCVEAASDAHNTVEIWLLAPSYQYLQEVLGCSCICLPHDYHCWLLYFCCCCSAPLLLLLSPSAAAAQPQRCCCSAPMLLLLGLSTAAAQPSAPPPPVAPCAAE